MANSNGDNKRSLATAIMSSYEAAAIVGALEAAGATEGLFRLIRSKKEVAEAMVVAGIAFALANLPKTEKDPSRWEYAGEE